MPKISASVLAELDSRSRDGYNSGQLSKLPLPIRIGAAAAIVEKVLSLFSGFFQKEFRGGGEMVELAWTFAIQGKDAPERRRELIDGSVRAIETASGMGYDPSQVAMAAYLLHEIGCQDGSGAESAIDYEATGFAVLVFFNLGMTRDSGKSEFGLFYQLRAPVFRAARLIVERGARLPVNKLERSCFFDVPIRFPFLVPPRARGGHAKLPKGVPAREILS